MTAISQEGHTYYFNITYHCNNHCLFCAADLCLDKKKGRDISLDRFQKILSEISFHDSDRVIINGGEPTVHNQFFEFLREVRKNKTKLIIFSNGCNFSSEEFTQRIAQFAPLEILIPIYSVDPAFHDRMTGRKGSLTQTLQGVRNIFSLQSDGYDITIEFRILLSVYTREHALDVIRYLLHEFPNQKFTISINPLIISKQVKTGGHAEPLTNYIPLITEIEKETRHSGHKIIFQSLPFCILWKINPGLVVNQIVQDRQRKKETYFDPDQVITESSGNSENIYAKQCFGCAAKHCCPGFPVGHLNTFGDSDAAPITTGDLNGLASKILINSLNTTDRIRVCDSSRLALPDGNIIWMNPENGSWCIPAYPHIIQAIETGESPTVSELRNTYPSDEVDQSICELLFSGMGEVNGLKLVSDNLLETGRPRPSGLSIIVLKYTRRCNLNCSYCYAHDNNNHRDMPNELILEILDKLKPCLGQSVHILIHGGEPLLRFKDLQKLCSLLETHDLNERISIGIQTNATLITEEIAQFLKMKKIDVGISIDGFTLEGNAYRCYPDGRPSLDKSLTGLLHLIETGNDPGLIMVMTEKNTDTLLDSVKSFYSSGVRNFVINPLFYGGAGKDLEPDKIPDPQKISDALISILLWMNDTNAGKTRKVYERNLETLVKHLTSYDRPYMCASVPCGACRYTITVDVDGTIYPCDDFITIPGLRMGSVHEVRNCQDFFQKSSIAQAFRQRNISKMIPCSGCVWRGVCPTRCASESYFAYGDILHEGMLCESMKILIPRILSLLISGRISKENLIRKPC